MAGKPSNKKSVLCLKEILERYTDEETVLNAEELIQLLENEYQIISERKSVYHDLALLSDFGLDIKKETAPKRGYHLVSRDFELSEVRLLIDAVQAANFITKDKTRSLINRLLADLVSEQKAQALKEQVYIDARNKCKNECILYHIDGLYEAIQKKKKVRMDYSKRVFVKGSKTEFETKTHEISPYALIWSNDHYYLVGNLAQYNDLTHFRIDRITALEMINEDIRPIKEVSNYKIKLDSADYASKHFNMYAGKVQTVELECSSRIYEAMVDRFSNECVIKIKHNDRFSVIVRVSVDDGLVSWLSQYGCDLVVIRPQSLIEMMKEKARGILSLYENGHDTV